MINNVNVIHAVESNDIPHFFKQKLMKIGLVVSDL